MIKLRIFTKQRSKFKAAVQADQKKRSTKSAEARIFLKNNMGNNFCESESTNILLIKIAVLINSKSVL